ncbi:MAG: DUF2804 domain-containing protein [Candidatus Izemoplasmatales bacterium]|jgi:hypothetical protein|nr:DUF2804 domain-containing protein [Candidatus Izemoplasmatales bacterium]MDD5601798.1 DUF2804 domain-containing protein [Candidatus Izemoplasmatales bacterium]
MMQQNRIVTQQKLLNEKGLLANPGYATEPLFDYDRELIAASKWRIKEWDYYAALTRDYGVAFVISDLGYSALISVVFLDFQKKAIQKKTLLQWFPFGSLKLPKSSLEGDVHFHKKGVDLSFVRTPEQRVITAHIQDFLPEQDFHAELILEDLKDESLVIATPWAHKPKAFYYNQKINCMPTEGVVKIGNARYVFSKKTAFSVLDWGRGVWTYKNTWYWGSLSGIVNGKRFGMNLGYGFGDTTQATENMVFYEGKAHKLDQVSFTIQEPDFLKPWKFHDNEGRLQMTMKPLIDREDTMNLGIIKNLGHQVFGKFSGTVLLDDGSKIDFQDVIGFAEKITNHY